jgi:hypothetical protein
MAMHPAWRPISRSEFDSLVGEQVAALEKGQKAMLESCRVEPWQAIIRRSEEAGDERVWVIAQRQGEVLYFDDVEWGWNSSGVNKEGRLLRPGGGQGELRDVLGSEDASG